MASKYYKVITTEDVIFVFATDEFQAERIALEEIERMDREVGVFRSEDIIRIEEVD